MSDVLSQNNLFLQRIAKGHRGAIYIDDTSTHSFSTEECHCIHGVSGFNIAALTDATITGSSGFSTGDTVAANVDIYGHITSLRLSAGRVLCYLW